MLKRLSVFLVVALFLFTGWGHVTHAAGGIELYTPYTGISVAPGDNVTYDVDVINHTGSIQDVTFSVKNLPKGFTAKLSAGSWEVHQLSVKPGESQKMTVDLSVPLKIEKGTYRFSIVAKGDGTSATLPLSVTTSQSGTYESEFKVDQANMEGTDSSTFDFTATLQNHTAKDQRYSLSSSAPSGWDVQFQVDGKGVTSVQLDPNTTKDITVHIEPPKNVKAGTYEIPITASSGATDAKTTLDVVITGTYSMEVSTPNDNLSTDITSGNSKTLTFLVKNTGSGTLRNVKLSASTPDDWNVDFGPDTIKSIAPGKTAEVKATIHASDKAIAGDYVVNVSAQSDDTYAEAKLRVTVKTSWLWGWVGVIIVLAVIGGIYYLIRKYGRR
ncbi:MAG: NEW3 domain-containing protein [Tuberibacillus sp.]